MTSTTRSAHAGRTTLSNSSWYLDQLITFLLTGEDTDGQFALLRVHGIQGAEPPPTTTRARTRPSTCWTER